MSVLEDQGHGLAPKLPHVFLGSGHQVDAVEEYLSTGYLAIVGKEAHDRQRQRALSGAALADDAEHFLLFLRERNAVHGVHDPVGHAELDLEVLDLQH